VELSKVSALSFTIFGDFLTSCAGTPPISTEAGWGAVLQELNKGPTTRDDSKSELYPGQRHCDDVRMCSLLVGQKGGQGVKRQGLQHHEVAHRVKITAQQVATEQSRMALPAT